MQKRKRRIILADKNEILFGNTTRADLDELIYGFISVRVHNNMHLPEWARTGLPGGMYSEEFSKFEARKFLFYLEDEEIEGYNFDI